METEKCWIFVVERTLPLSSVCPKTRLQHFINVHKWGCSTHKTYLLMTVAVCETPLPAKAPCLLGVAPGQKFSYAMPLSGYREVIIVSVLLSHRALRSHSRWVRYLHTVYSGHTAYVHSPCIASESAQPGAALHQLVMLGSYTWHLLNCCCINHESCTSCCTVCHMLG